MKIISAVLSWSLSLISIVTINRKKRIRKLDVANELKNIAVEDEQPRTLNIPGLSEWQELSGYEGMKFEIKQLNCIEMYEPVMIQKRSFMRIIKMDWCFLVCLAQSFRNI
jgi:hypothetical protein